MSDRPIVGTLDERLVTGEQPHRRGRSYPTVEVGQVWVDRDQRMSSGNRRVTVKVSDPNGFVTYENYGRRYRSRYQRFQRAFKLVAASGDGPR